jgi:site-specific recombinase XerD
LENLYPTSQFKVFFNYLTEEMMETCQIKFSQALHGYTLYAKVRRFSPNTLNDYGNTFVKFQKFLDDDPPLSAITKFQVQEFLSSYDHLCDKTLLNYHTGLASLWTWAVAEGFVETHVIRQITPPKPEKKAINPFTEQDVKLMLIACKRSRSHYRLNQPEKSTYSLPCFKRNKAIILTLLDTGLRASELCSASIADLDLENKQITVMGKGDKERVLEISNKTSHAIWRYLMERPDYSDDTPLFSKEQDLFLSRGGLLQLVKRVGDRAGVHNAHPHRFRHTFAINFLRNGGNIYALQKLLGHSSLDMVKRYLQLSEQDCAAAHRIASPVANWDL